MQILLQSNGHAKSLAKSLRRSMAADGRELKLTAAQNAVARMLGHADHRSLCAGVGKGAPDPFDDEMTPEAAAARRETFAVRLAAALEVSPDRGRVLVAEIGPLRRARGYADDWRARRQSYFAKWPLGDYEDRFDASLLRGMTFEAPIVVPADLRFGPKARTVETMFGRRTESEFGGVENVAAKDRFGVEYVIATIRDGERVLGWLRGVSADMGSAETRRDLEIAGEALDDGLALRAGQLFERRVAQEPTIEIAQPFGRVLVVAVLIRDPRATAPGAGAALFAEAAKVISGRYRSPFCVVLNATPPQYDFAPNFPHPKTATADDRALRSTGRASAAQSLRSHLLALPFPDSVNGEGRIFPSDVSAFDLDLPYRCAAPSLGTGSSHPIDEAGDLFQDLDFRKENDVVGDRGRTRALFRDAAAPGVAALLIDATPPEGFDLAAASAPGRAVRPHPLLWTRMPETVSRIEIRRTREERPWGRVRRALMDRPTMRAELVRAARGEPGPRTIPDGETDTVSFVFDNGTVAVVPERFFASGDFADVVGPAFTAAYGSILGFNPYTEEMSLGDLWSVLTSNVLLLYSGGNDVAFRDDRSGWLTSAELREQLADLGLDRSVDLDFVTQDIGAMTRVSDAEAQSIIANTTTKIFMRVDELDPATTKLAIETNRKGGDPLGFAGHAGGRLDLGKAGPASRAGRAAAPAWPRRIVLTRPQPFPDPGRRAP